VEKQQALKPINESSKSKLPFFLVAILVLVLCYVVFLLPSTAPQNTISEPQLDSSKIKSAQNGPTPLEMAEQRKARTESQNLLNDILPLRDELLNKGVDKWDNDNATFALNAIESGERLYARGSYIEALGSYQSAYETLKTSRDKVPALVKTNLDEGQQALARLDSEGAIRTFEFVLMLESEEAQAQAGLARAKALPLTAPLWQQANIDIQNQQWQAAEKKLIELIQYDPAFPDAAEQLASIQQTIQSERLTSLMSKGYQALSNKNVEQAEKSFKHALSQEPNNADIIAALEQVATVKQALATYDAMLEEYPNVAEIKAARLPATVRASLDSTYESIMSDPLKLGNERTHAKASRLLSDMQSISPAGPKLSSQVSELSSALVRAQTPVAITLLSDNATAVEVFRIGRFGALSEKVVELIPGHYVAAGNRSGYRDVHIPFTIDGLAAPEPIEVICTEPI